MKGKMVLAFSRDRKLMYIAGSEVRNTPYCEERK